MGNKVKYNLKNVHAAKMTEADQEGTPSFSYETPQAIPGAVSISLDAEGESSPFYADGIVYFCSVMNTDFIPAWRLPHSASESSLPEFLCQRNWEDSSVSVIS